MKEFPNPYTALPCEYLMRKIVDFITIVKASVKMKPHEIRQTSRDRALNTTQSCKPTISQFIASIIDNSAWKKFGKSVLDS